MTSIEPSPSVRRGRWLPVMATWCLVALLPCAQARTERLRRAIHELPGVPNGASDMAQDQAGFVWIAGNEGLARFDGVEALPWAPDVIRQTQEYVETGPHGEVCAGNTRGGLYEVVDQGAAPVRGPDGEPLTPVRHAAYDRDGKLWVLVEGRVLRREQDGWTVLATEKLAGEHAWRLLALPDGGMVVGTFGGGLWRVESGFAPSVAAIARGLGRAVSRLALDADGSILAIVRGRGVVRVRDGDVETLLEEPSRPTGLAVRRDVVWAVFTEGVFTLREGEPPRHFTKNDGFVGSGSVMVDRSGGLWLTSYRGVELYPEPDTVIFTEAPNHDRFRSVSVIPGARGGVWVSTWNGPLFRRDGETEWRSLETGEWWTAHYGCLDADGRVWASAWAKNSGGSPRTALLRYDEERLDVRLERPGPTHVFCDQDDDGVTWMVYGRDVMRLGPGEDTPGKVIELPSSSDTPAGIAVDAGLGLAVVTDREFCRTSSDRLDDLAGWSCAPIPDARRLRDVQAGPDGRWWAASEYAGLVALHEDGWRPALPTGTYRAYRVVGLTPSPRGGLWVATAVERFRVDVEDGELRVVERLSQSNGIPAWWSSGVVEQNDGAIWIPTAGGPVYVPATARQDTAAAPEVRLTRMLVDGEHHDGTVPVVLPFGDHQLEVHFSTFSYRDLANLSYRMRIGDGSWSRIRRPSVRLVGMSSGKHRVEVAASVDGSSWSAVPARVALDVARAWYATVWAWLGFVLGASVLLYAAYRLRMAHVLRLERQRTTIAMDLHDEMGAAVGGIGIMAAVAADDGASAEKRQQVARKIADAAEDLGASLYDIIWSLKIKGAGFGDLAAQLIERGGRLFPADRPRFSTVVPEDWPAGELALPVRREVQRIVVEALHNAAKHARASRVELGFDGDRDGCVVWVDDDGIGVDAAGSSGRGSRLGLDGMRRRAAGIGGRLEIGPGGSGGTRVELRFRADGAPWKPRPAKGEAADSRRTRRMPVRRSQEETP